MNIIKTEIQDVLIFEPEVYEDERGFFMESFNQRILEKNICKNVKFVQDNHSKSMQGVLRGLHYQLSPFAQGKLVRCTVGRVFDVAVDLRRTSETFGHYVSFELSAENKKILWIPEGFAHGFLVLSDVAEFQYKTTNYYSPKHERSIIWNDPILNIHWPILNESDLIISQKDAGAILFNNAE
ncbi:TPA: dTDP-4-dehydrorhamnose 3,5-epimerase, partial [Escherichia coli]|nr:dTDP-4-dehydrorhamnose 3,5-epimerase [Escherichia coli]